MTFCDLDMFDESCNDFKCGHSEFHAPSQSERCRALMFLSL